jgi:hypothetical protein
MSYVLFLNELSFGASADRWAADAAMAEFDKLLRKFFEWNDDTSLADHIGLDSIELSPGYSFREWINADRRNKERWNFIRLRRTKAPFRDKNLDLPGDVEYKYSAQAVRGLGLADHYYGLCVSLRVSDVWDSPHISVDRLALDEEAARSPEVTLNDERSSIVVPAKTLTVIGTGGNRQNPGFLSCARVGACAISVLG